MSRYELLIGRRYLRAGRGNRFVSFISVISMLGVAIGVAVLIVVLSVMNGFEQELRGRILSLTSHATISGFGAGISDWRTLAGEGDARIPRSWRRCAVCRGSGAAGGARQEQRRSSHGRAAGGGTQGRRDCRTRCRTAPSMHLLPASTASCSARNWRRHWAWRSAIAWSSRRPQPVVTPAGCHARGCAASRSSACSASGMYEFDRNLAYIHMADAAKLYRMGDAVSRVCA